jgi:pyruvate ferredoxin oxidoreductase delta subunit
MLKPLWNKEFKEPAGFNELHFGASNDVGVLPTVNSGFRTLTPHIDTETCIKCMFCWIFCPEGCIDKTEEVLKIDLDYCKGCGICAVECPKKCIEMVKE